jgi:hypothetical protein
MIGIPTTPLLPRKKKERRKKKKKVPPHFFPVLVLDVTLVKMTEKETKSFRSG